jgi:hypothetical protein
VSGPCPFCGAHVEHEPYTGHVRCAGCGRFCIPGQEPIPYRPPDPAPWWQGAQLEEVLGFRLSSVNPPDGSGIPGLDDRELRRQVALARHRLGDRATRTRWLETYARSLVREAEARNAEGAA